MAEQTVMELYRAARSRLAALPVEAPETEALLLCERYLNIKGRAALAVHGDEFPPQNAVQQLLSALEQRRDRPLQYIFGEWEFDGMQLRVGEGVLVPREDTTALVELASERLANVPSPLVLDLCAGSGAVALGMARRLPDARFVCVELSDKALPYLLENIERYAPGRVTVIKADVLNAPPFSTYFAPRSYDAVVSNPPYIPTGEISELSREVHQEPSMALDGGSDGMVFYRAIAKLWLPLLRENGVLACEVGFEQMNDIKGIFVRNDLTDIAIKRDFSDIERAIIGTLSI